MQSRGYFFLELLANGLPASPKAVRLRLSADPRGWSLGAGWRGVLSWIAAKGGHVDMPRVMLGTGGHEGLSGRVGRASFSDLVHGDRTQSHTIWFCSLQSLWCVRQAAILAALKMGYRGIDTSEMNRTFSAHCATRHHALCNQCQPNPGPSGAYLSQVHRIKCQRV